MKAKPAKSTKFAVRSDFIYLGGFGLSLVAMAAIGWAGSYLFTAYVPGYEAAITVVSTVVTVSLYAGINGLYAWIVLGRNRSSRPAAIMTTITTAVLGILTILATELSMPTIYNDAGEYVAYQILAFCAFGLVYPLSLFLSRHYRRPKP